MHSISKNNIQKSLNNAISIIVAHNHPSDELIPSKEDITIAQRLKEIGKWIDIEVLGNIIFNKKEYYSLKYGGYI